MDGTRRLDCLQSIGIDVWVSRHAPAAVAAPADTPAARAADVHAAAAKGSPADASVAPAFREAPERPTDSAVPPPRRPMTAILEPARPRPLEERPSSRPPAVPESGPLSADIEAQWDALKSEVLSCKKCTLHSTRTQGVFGVGNRRADWLIIGEAPGAEEDRQGEPFVGRAGQLLNQMLRAIGLPRESVFIANVLKSRPPGNRDPKPEEVAACLPYLIRQIALLQPKLMLAVGRIAAQNLLATDLSLGRLRGQVHTFGELNTPLIVTYHPAYLLRTPADKRKAWEDLKFARSVFQRLASQES
jgi:DNA polymerase